MNDRRQGSKPAIVSDRTKQAGEIRDRWSWVEPGVWTGRMLTALEENAYFAELGLFSMVTAHEEACQSSRR